MFWWILCYWDSLILLFFLFWIRDSTRFWLPLAFSDHCVYGCDSTFVAKYCIGYFIRRKAINLTSPEIFLKNEPFDWCRLLLNVPEVRNMAAVTLTIFLWEVFCFLKTSSALLPRSKTFSVENTILFYMFVLIF